MKGIVLAVRPIAMWALMVGTCASLACAAEEVAQHGYEVHDVKRPQPPVITPGTPSTDQQPGKPPSDAIVLFGGSEQDLAKWQTDRSEKEIKAAAPAKPAEWKVEDRQLVVVPRTGTIATKDQFRDVQLHAEFWHPADITGKGQGRGNSGIFLMGLYELQVLDNYNAETYADGMIGSMYGQYPPLVNAAREPGQWQIYDVIFRAPRYEGEKVAKPARMTVLLNGVVVQDNVELLGPSKHKLLTEYPRKHPEKGPIKLQDHGQPVRFRNIWVRELQEPPPPAARPAADAKKPPPTPAE
ncbi:MAG TPA: DUF1080 domain-containing protein [Tepidisphaeraceae bacterium]|nr:DUF1080 domain-containing protein [Tepidisphaeraceae bacterium]